MKFDDLSSDELVIFNAIRKSRTLRFGAHGVGLCSDPNCTTGCNGIFREVIKEALADEGADPTYLRALEPHLRGRVKSFCLNRRGLLEHHELARLQIFCNELDLRIPEEAEIYARLKEARERERKQHEEAWRASVEEARAKKRAETQLRHKRRLERKRERDYYYWIAYWAAKHAIEDENQRRSAYKKTNRNILENVFWRLKSKATKLIRRF